MAGFRDVTETFSGVTEGLRCVTDVETEGVLGDIRGHLRKLHRFWRLYMCAYSEVLESPVR